MKIAILTTDNREALKDYRCPKPYFGTAPEALLQGFATLPETEVHVLSCVRQEMPPMQLAANIWHHPLLVPKIGWMTTGYQGCIRAIRKKLQQLQPDIVHGQGTERECAISAIFSGFPNVVTIHGNMRLIAQLGKPALFSFGWLNAKLEGFTLPRTDGIVCITRYTQEAVRRDNPRTWLLPNAVDEAFFSVHSQPFTADEPVIICVGYICPRKNQNRFIQALDPVAARHRFRVLFLGQTTAERAYDDEFFRLVKARSWCEYGGFADRERLRTVFKSASLLALPSLEDNCPMAILEAMAAGLPVIGAKVGGVPDLIEEGVTGLFCDPLDDASMAQSIERALSDPTAAKARAKTAAAKAKQRFHPRVVAQQHVAIYREVLGKAS